MAKPDWITLSKSSGSGNDTVTVTAAKNTSTTARSGSITVTSGSLSKVVTISQEGQAVSTIGEITLHFTGTLPNKDYIGETIYASIYDGYTAEFSQKAGIIKNVTSNTVDIDISGMSQGEIQEFYTDFVNGDQVEEATVYFGMSETGNTESSWEPFLKTTETGDWNYATEYVANIWEQAYAGSTETIECSILEGDTPITSTYYMHMQFELAKIVMPYDVFSDASLSTIDFFPRITTANGKTVDGARLTLKASTVVGQSSTGSLWCDIDEFDVGQTDSIVKIEIFAVVGSTSPFPVLEGTINGGSTFNFTNSTQLNKQYSATFADGSSGNNMGFYFSSSNRIPIVETTDGSFNIIALNSSAPTITINAIA